MSCSGVWFCQPFHTFCNIFLVIILKIYAKMREVTAATEFTKPGDHLFSSLYTLNDSSLNGSLSWAVLISPQICVSCSNFLLGEHITWYFYILICDRWISAFFLYNSSVSSANCWTLPMIKPYWILVFDNQIYEESGVLFVQPPSGLTRIGIIHSWPFPLSCEPCRESCMTCWFNESVAFWLFR